MKSEIVFVQWNNGFGGLEKITTYYESIFINRNSKVLLFEYHQSGFQYKNYKLIDKSKKIRFLTEFIKFTRQRRDFLFHFQIPEIFLLLLTYLLGVRKIVCQFHGCHTSRKLPEKLLWKFLERKIRIIVNSKYSKNEIKKKYWLTRDITIIPNFIDEKEFVYNERNYNEEKFIVTYAGRLAKGKNLLLLLETAKHIKDDKNEIEFRIYGEGPEMENLKLKVREFSIENKVKFFPFSKNIAQIYKESHLFIFMSLFETFGNVVVEAILTGLPVLCYKIPSLAEFIHDDYFFFSEKNPHLIASRIIEMKDNYSISNEKLITVHDAVKKYISNSKIIADIENIYVQLERN